MRARRAQPVVCLVAIAAYLLNLAAAAGGAALCREPAGEASIEFACDHDHCAASVESEHEHDHGFDPCWCSSCPCEDTPLAVWAAPLLRSGDVRASTPKPSTFAFVPRCETQKLAASRVARADRSPPAPDRSLRRLRTVVLIV